MTDHPIPFSAPMIRALLDGTKTQTRRVTQTKRTALHTSFELEALYEAGWNVTDSEDCYGEHLFKLPHRPGDLLWVRENHYLTDDGESEYAVYAADEGDVEQHLANMQTTMASHPSIDWSKHLRLRPSIHMPRWVSRLTLTVTDVRVQRLQDISMEDAIAEGIEPYSGIDPGCFGYLNYQNNSEDGYWLGPTHSFRTLWNSINGPDAWDANPWVTATSFTVHKCNIDQMEQAND